MFKIFFQFFIDQTVDLFEEIIIILSEIIKNIGMFIYYILLIIIRFLSVVIMIPILIKGNIKIRCILKNKKIRYFYFKVKNYDNYLNLLNILKVNNIEGILLIKKIRPEIYNMYKDSDIKKLHKILISKIIYLNNR